MISCNLVVLYRTTAFNCMEIYGTTACNSMVIQEIAACNGMEIYRMFACGEIEGVAFMPSGVQVLGIHMGWKYKIDHEEKRGWGKLIHPHWWWSDDARSLGIRIRNTDQDYFKSSWIRMWRVEDVFSAKHKPLEDHPFCISMWRNTLMPSNKTRLHPTNHKQPHKFIQVDSCKCQIWMYVLLS